MRWNTKLIGLIMIFTTNNRLITFSDYISTIQLSITCSDISIIIKPATVPTTRFTFMAYWPHNLHVTGCKK